MYELAVCYYGGGFNGVAFPTLKAAMAEFEYCKRRSRVCAVEIIHKGKVIKSWR